MTTTDVARRLEVSPELWPLDKQAVHLEAIPSEAVARALQAHGFTTWAEVDEWFASGPGVIYLYPGVGNNGVHWLRCELARRKRAVYYSATGTVSVPHFAKLPVPGHCRTRSGVYFIQCGPFVKIGLARNVRRRFLSLQQVIPFQLELLGVVEPVEDQPLRVLESEYHRRFKACRQVGEWFRLEGDLDIFCLALARGEIAA